MALQRFLQEEIIKIRKSGAPAHQSIPLTGSKSESNRALALNCLSNGRIKVENVSEADDTYIMLSILEALKQRSQESEARNLDPLTLNVGPAGTVMRFMTAILSIQYGSFILTGSERMKQRPIQLLVDALSEIGAQITYIEQVGYPPLHIKGPFKQKSNRVKIAGDVSSQYLSALLMIAPTLPQGLSLQIIGPLTSKPYLTMTLELLERSGIQHTWTGDTITIEAQKFQANTIHVEPDWSAASYWYSLLALRKKGQVLLPGLRSASLQGDRAIARIMEAFGVQTTHTTSGVQIAYAPNSNPTAGADTAGSVLDFTECPDLAQTVIACAAALQLNLSFTGLHTLRIKETDRIHALQQEIAKFGVKLIDEDPIFHLDCSGFFKPQKLSVATYEDHRMAMAFAPLAEIFDELHIEHPKVVEKSYPDFWIHLQEQGFEIN